MKSGHGTAADPYVIAHWCFSASVVQVADILLMETTAHVVIEANTFGGPVSSGVAGGRDAAVALDKAQNVTIRGNDVSGHSGWGVWMQDVRQVVVLDNDFVSTSGITVRAGSSGVTIERNRVMDSALDAVSLSSSQDLVVRDNVIAQTETSNALWSGLVARTVHGLVVEGNLIIGHGGDGVAFDRGSHDNVVRNNSIRLNGVGMEIRRDSDRNLVFANNLTENRLGLRLSDSRDVQVRDNNFQNELLGMYVRNGSAAHAPDNWWGCPDGPDDPACDQVQGAVDAAPWRSTANPEAGAPGPFADPGVPQDAPIVYGSFDGTPDGPLPHVLVGVPDTGINPYHEIYHRPNLTVHPCTYIPGFPCDIPALPLTVGGDDYDAALAADQEVWDSVVRGQWYWIPQTAIVAASCDVTEPSICILDDSRSHGTGSSSSVLMENPHALLAIKDGGARVQPFVDAGIPVDIFSVSWGNMVPVPGHPDVVCPNHERSPLHVVAAGNDPRSTWVDCWKGDPALITVGGADPEAGSEELMAAKQTEVVSYYCRPTAGSATTSGFYDSTCGTSFAAPTVAGALSKTLLAVRETSGYTGGIAGDCIDPLADLTAGELREAMNRTARYEHETRYRGPSTSRPVPQNTLMPWLQWGWGFFDGDVADDTTAHVLGIAVAPEKPPGAQEHMARQYALKDALYGPLEAREDTGCGPT